MPVQSCRSGKKPGYRWGGPSQTCYTYTPGNDAERREAKRKAIIQGSAIEARRGKASLTGEQFTALSEQALTDAEQKHLPALTAAWQTTIAQAGRTAYERFALTAAAEPGWQPPPEGWTLTPAAIAELAATLDGRLAPIFAAIVNEVGGVPLARVEIAWDVSHPLAEGLLARAGGRTGARLGEAVQHQLRLILADAYAQGLSVRETAAQIRTGIAGAAPWQADMLARTDLVALSNGSSKAAASLVGMGFKSWISARDSKVRPDHVDADGQTVPIGQPFVVCGGEEADFPADPALSAECAANCRCTLIYGETLKEAEGLLASADSSMIPGMASAKQRERRAARLKAAAKENGQASRAAARGALAVAPELQDEPPVPDESVAAENPWPRRLQAARRARADTIAAAKPEAELAVLDQEIEAALGTLMTVSELASDNERLQEQLEQTKREAQQDRQLSVVSERRELLAQIQRLTEAVAEGRRPRRITIERDEQGNAISYNQEVIDS